MLFEAFADAPLASLKAYCTPCPCCHQHPSPWNGRPPAPTPCQTLSNAPLGITKTAPRPMSLLPAVHQLLGTRKAPAQSACQTLSNAPLGITKTALRPMPLLSAVYDSLAPGRPQHKLPARPSAMRPSASLKLHRAPCPCYLKDTTHGHREGPRTDLLLDADADIGAAKRNALLRRPSASQLSFRSQQRVITAAVQEVCGVGRGDRVEC